MGMDGVEMVMQVEDAFGISIEDGEAEKIQTPRQLIDLVASKISTEGVQRCMSQRAFHRLRHVMISRLGLERKRIRVDARLNSLIPLTVRRALWAAIGQETQSTGWPELRPGWLPPCLGLIAGSAATVWGKNLWQLGHNGTLAMWLGLTVALMFGAVRGWRPINSAFPQDCQTVSDLTLLYVRNNPELLEDGRRAWSQEEAASIVRKIIRDVLGVDQFDDDDDFVKDLGLG